MKAIERVIKTMIESIKNILQDNLLSIYIYGSYVLNDFKLGWSDIDILVLTNEKIDDACAERLLHLRQELLEIESKNKFYRSFEGAFLSLDCFLSQGAENVVYWGTKGEKIKESYILDSFSRKELVENSKLVYGYDLRDKFSKPTYNELVKDVQKHYETIKEQGKNTGRNVYSFGWVLDISRCLYTLQTGEIISKTKAGEWALKNGLCPDPKVLKRIIKIRKKPNKYLKKEEVMNYAETLGPYVQRYANVLCDFLNKVNV